MKKTFFAWAIALVCLISVTPCSAQFNLKKAIKGATSAVKAVTLTDEQMT